MSPAKLSEVEGIPGPGNQDQETKNRTNLASNRVSHLNLTGGVVKIPRPTSYLLIKSKFKSDFLINCL